MSAALEPAYEYRAVVVRWIDGDTVELNVDLGFRLGMVDRFRLTGIDTPERGRPMSAESWIRAKELAPAGSEVLIYTGMADKYGRWLAHVYPPSGQSVNDTLLEEGLAVPYSGGAKRAD